jgi:hypothetical protein
MSKTHKFTADWTYRTPEVTIEFTAGTETPLADDVLKAAIAAGVIDGAKGPAPTE